MVTEREDIFLNASVNKRKTMENGGFRETNELQKCQSFASKETVFFDVMFINVQELKSKQAPVYAVQSSTKPALRIPFTWI